MAKRPISAAQLAHCRAIAKFAGRPSKPSSRDSIAKFAKARLARKRARGILSSAAEESAHTLVAAMRGQLEGSDASSMASAAKTILAKVGIPDITQANLKLPTKGPGITLTIGAPDRTAGANYPAADSRKGDDDRNEGTEPPLAN